MAKVKLKISKDGSKIIAVHNDKFDLAMFGEVRRQRASEVYFDNEKQKWMVSLYITGEMLDPEGYDTREEAITAEVDWLSEHLPDDVPKKAYNDLSDNEWVS